MYYLIISKKPTAKTKLISEMEPAFFGQCLSQTSFYEEHSAAWLLKSRAFVAMVKDGKNNEIKQVVSRSYFLIVGIHFRIMNLHIIYCYNYGNLKK